MSENQENNKTKVTIRDLFLGSILTHPAIMKWMPMFVLLAVLSLVMISTRYKGERVLRQIVVFQDSVRDLRSESVTIDSKLLNQSRYSQIQSRCDEANLGLKKPNTPPTKIKVN